VVIPVEEKDTYHQSDEIPPKYLRFVPQKETKINEDDADLLAQHPNRSDMLCIYIYIM
jgi:hypothetical protein